MLDRLYAPIGVAVAHVVIIVICVCYDPSLFDLSQGKGVVSLLLCAASMYTLFKCALMDPGIVRGPHADLELQTIHEGSSDVSDSELEPGVGKEPTLRYCAICEIYQPLRTKHCEELNVCVRTFDHYCPWISNCVGEFNRAWFLLYLVVESLALTWFFAEGLSKISVHAGNAQVLASLSALILALTVMSVFLLMTGLLVPYHVFLCVTNVTTWEQTSWRKITYLKNLREADGSPFAAPTTMGNIRMYMRSPGAVEIGPDGGVVWRLGTQRTIVPACFHACCDL